MAGEGLSIETGSSAAQEARESCGQCEVAYGIGLHEEFLSSVGPGVSTWRFGVMTRRPGRASSTTWEAALPMPPV